MRRAYLVVATVFFCGQVAAQTITIDLDRLSKVAYCLGVDTEFQKEMAKWPDECKAENNPTEEIRRSRETACTARRNGAAELKRKVDLYNLYIIIRIDVTAALLTSMTSKSDGTADVGRCFTAVGILRSAIGACPSPTPPFTMKAFDEQQSCVEKNTPPACRRVRECATLDMP